MPVILFFALIFCIGAWANEEEQAHVRVALISELQTISAGQPFWVGLFFKMAPEWHIYWKNSGDSGLPPQISWQLPEGFKAGEIRWPMPHRLVSDDLATYVYEQEVLLPVIIHPPEQIDRDSVIIRAKVDWLACREACIPGTADLILKLQVAERAVPGELADIFRRYKKALPKPLHHPGILYSIRDSLLVIQFPREVFPEPPGQLYFYPETPFFIQHAAQQTVQAAGDAFILSIPLNPFAAVPDTAISGVLEATLKNGRMSNFLLQKIDKQSN